MTHLSAGRAHVPCFLLQLVCMCVLVSFKHICVSYRNDPFFSRMCSHVLVVQVCMCVCLSMWSSLQRRLSLFGGQQTNVCSYVVFVCLWTVYHKHFPSSVLRGLWRWPMFWQEMHRCPFIAHVHLSVWIVLQRFHSLLGACVLKFTHVYTGYKCIFYVYVCVECTAKSAMFWCFVFYEDDQSFDRIFMMASVVFMYMCVLSVWLLVQKIHFFLVCVVKLTRL